MRFRNILFIYNFYILRILIIRMKTLSLQMKKDENKTGSKSNH